MHFSSRTRDAISAGMGPNDHEPEHDEPERPNPGDPGFEQPEPKEPTPLEEDPRVPDFEKERDISHHAGMFV